MKINEMQTIENSPSYNFSSMKSDLLRELFEINQKIAKNEFDLWFNHPYEIEKDTQCFLKELIVENKDLIKRYSEEDLKASFIIPLLNKIKFRNIEKEWRDFYHAELCYKTDEFILKGYCDFYVSTGIFRPKSPYFFIQEFKQDKNTSHPETQLLAELICAVELNKIRLIKGAYIVGEIWNFVILERIEKHKYQYFVSPNFDSMRVDDLNKIYKNLRFVKKEIINIMDNL